MLFSYLSLSPSSELKLRRKKAETKRITRQSLKVLQNQRIEHYEAIKSVKDVVSDVLSECVEAVDEMLSDKARARDEQKEDEDEATWEAVTLPKKVKRKRQ